MKIFNFISFISWFFILLAFVDFCRALDFNCQWKAFEPSFLPTTDQNAPFSSSQSKISFDIIGNGKYIRIFQDLKTKEEGKVFSFFYWNVGVFTCFAGTSHQVGYVWRTKTLLVKPRSAVGKSLRITGLPLVVLVVSSSLWMAHHSTTFTLVSELRKQFVVKWWWQEQMRKYRKDECFNWRSEWH